MYLSRTTVVILFIVTLTTIGAVIGSNSREDKIIDNHTINKLDLNSYIGLWYEIARFDNRFERNLECVTAHYSFQPNGRIIVLNRGYNTVSKRWSEANGKAKMTNEVGRLRVSFFWWFYSDYRILAVGDKGANGKYEWALVGSKSAEYLWILARERDISPDTFAKIIGIASARGYDPQQLILVGKNCD